MGVIGELDFSKLCLSVENDSISITSYVLEVTFILFFVFIVVVVLMNMLNGLAVSIVSDQKSIATKTEVIRFKSVLKDLSFLEDSFLWLNLHWAWNLYCRVLKDQQSFFYVAADKYTLKMILTRKESERFKESEEKDKGIWKRRVTKLFPMDYELTKYDPLRKSPLRAILKNKEKQNDFTNAQLKESIQETQETIKKLEEHVENTLQSLKLRKEVI